MLAKPGCDLRWYLLDLSFSTEYPPNIQPSVSECHRAEEWSLLVLLYSCLAFAPLTSSHSVHGRCFPLPVVQTVFFPIWNIPNFIFYKNCFKLFSISDSQPHRKVFCRKLWHPLTAPYVCHTVRFPQNTGAVVSSYLKTYDAGGTAASCARK